MISNLSPQKMRMLEENRIASDEGHFDFIDFEDLRVSYALPQVVDLVMNRCPCDSFDHMDIGATH